MDSSRIRGFFERKVHWSCVSTSSLRRGEGSEGSCCVPGVEAALFFVANIGRDRLNLSVISETLELMSDLDSNVKAHFGDFLAILDDVYLNLSH